jgi:hypothetical protein
LRTVHEREKPLLKSSHTSSVPVLAFSRSPPAGELPSVAPPGKPVGGLLGKDGLQCGEPEPGANRDRDYPPGRAGGGEGEDPATTGESE